mmetsp:Transcript_25940/g.86380  ORF Transcript_25940/g.86380 Transcript_25940/m.86380 type:complete len:109 (-) Transcript_25940:61-387(-)
MLPEKLEVTQCVIDDEKRTAVLEALVAAVAEKGAIPVSNGVYDYDVDVFPEAAAATPPSSEDLRCCERGRASHRQVAGRGEAERRQARAFLACVYGSVVSRSSEALIA